MREIMYLRTGASGVVGALEERLFGEEET